MTPRWWRRDYPGVAYRAFDLQEAGPERTREMLGELMGLFAAGALGPLPVTAWDIRRAPEAFRFISQARHTGKVVLTMPARLGAGPVLVTGGTGTVGAVVARHLAAGRTGGALVLASRRGPGAPGAGRLAAELAARGAAVRVTACDTADRDELAGLVAGTAGLAGVVHSAAALDDATVGSLTAQRFEGVLGPKADAAWYLHELTAGLDLDLFALFSSAAGTLGNPGQGNYAAANAVVDSLAAWRRAQGLPAVSLAWGFWAQISELTGEMDQVDLARLRRAGSVPLTSGQGLALFDAGIAGPDAALVAAGFDPAALGALNQAGTLPPMLRGLVREQAAPAGPGRPDREAGLAGRLAGLDRDGQRRLLLDAVRGQAAAVLGHGSPAAVPGDRAFRDLGFDSLTAVELRNRLTAATGLRLTTTLVFDYPTPATLAAHLLAQFQPEAAPAQPALIPAASSALDAAGPEPIAVVGIGCRFPGGAESAEELWNLVNAGSDAVGDFPPDRGWDAAGGSYARRGGFVYGAAGFDAGFFGISPREALAMDPQQRLLLECAWQALEDAGIDPATLRGSDTGVFAGVTSQDYGLQLREADAGDAGGFGVTGGMASVASGRVSYVLGLEGPAVSVDTACSSSLVALHLAAQSLRRGECSLALAGGVAVMATLVAFTEFSRQQGLAADGRCKPFAAAADGTGWGEGVGLLVVERLSDAVRNGHQVLGLVAGSAVNQDGASNGLTAPNGPSQERVIRSALADARLGTADVDLVEAHGTGTTLGDPIEAGALLATYGQGRPEGDPLWLGSIKSNIGHAQAAAGVAGVIKVLMALRHQRMPATLHADAPSPHVNWDSGQVSLLSQARDWPAGPERVRRAGVSAFGVSGTNAHVIIEEPPAPAPDPDEDPARLGGVVAWPLSAKTPAALAGQAARLAEFVGARPGLDPAAVAAGLAGRSAFAERAVVTGSSRAELLGGLAALAAGEPAAGLVTGAAPGEPGPVVLVFPGQGGQWAGMGAGLWDCCPAFRERLAACDEAFGPLVGWRVSDVLRGAAGAPPLERPDVVQPALFSVMVSLAAAWEAAGVVPAAVAGHSQGEIAAACVAGVLSLGDAALVVAARSRALARLAGTGAMASVRASEELAAELAARWAGRLAVGVVNSPGSVVVSGEPGAVRELVAACGGRGVDARLLAVDYASHSPQVEQVEREVAQALAGIAPGPGAVPFYSALTGGLLEGTALDGRYWYDSLRGQVRFDAVVRSLAAAGHGAFVEVSPHPVLTAAISQTLDETRAPGDQDRAGTAPVTVTGTLRRGDGGPARFAASVAAAWAAGLPADWAALAGPAGRAELPGYAFQRQRYWLTQKSRDVGAAGLDDAGGHPLLGAVLELPDGSVAVTGRLSLADHPWLAEHVVHGTVIAPGTLLAELAWHAATLAGCPVIEDLSLLTPLTMPAAGGMQLRVIAGPADPAQRRTVSVAARMARSGGEWILHAEGTAGPGEPSAPPAPAGQWPPAGAVPVPVEQGYARLAAAGYQHGPAFRAVRALWRRGDEVFAELAADEEVVGAGAAAGRFALHPVLLDAALQSAGIGRPGAGGRGRGRAAGPLRLDQPGHRPGRGRGTAGHRSPGGQCGGLGHGYRRRRVDRRPGRPGAVPAGQRAAGRRGRERPGTADPGLGPDPGRAASRPGRRAGPAAGRGHPARQRRPARHGPGYLRQHAANRAGLAGIARARRAAAGRRHPRRRRRAPRRRGHGRPRRAGCRGSLGPGPVGAGRAAGPAGAGRHRRVGRAGPTASRGRLRRAGARHPGRAGAGPEAALRPSGRRALPARRLPGLAADRDRARHPGRAGARR